MILSDLLKYGKNELNRSGCDNTAFDAQCLLENVTGFNRTQLFLNADIELGAEKEQQYKNLVDRRCNREPLQYIIGKWEFMGFDFYVGPGCLIPRPETEGLVYAAVSYIKDKREPVVFDLCAGTGCIGISIANICGNSKVYLIEKSEEALYYLKRNIKQSGLPNTTAVQGNIFDGFLSFNLPAPDVIVSNPPYIPTKELDSLQAEVMFEPAEALDGGEDGLVFYREINRVWFPYLNNGGILAVEVGDNQAKRISTLFSTPYKEKKYLLDANKIKRIIIVNK